jgi:hypothetical protein
MDVSQARRFELYDKMRQTIGNDHAATLMEILPPMDANDIATKRDVENATVVMRGEMTELRSELRREITELRTDLRTEMADLRVDLTGMTHSELGAMRADLSTALGMINAQFGELRGEFKASTRHTIVTVVAAATTVWLTAVIPTLF